MTDKAQWRDNQNAKRRAYRLMPRAEAEALAAAHWADRFWARTDRSDCWNWTGPKDPKNYGAVSWKGRQFPAPRIAWRLARGPIPPGMFICHHCDNPRCVRPDHLFLGSPLDNIADRTAKGRSANGERNGNARLTAEQVREARAAVAGGASRRAVARQLGVEPTAIERIINGRRWRNVA